MTKATVILEVRVTIDVPDHILKRDRKLEEMSEEDVWHDYAVGAVHRSVDVRHGTDDDHDWVTLSAEVTECELEGDPQHDGHDD